MISPEEERYILSRASVPEHIVGLMTGISRGEAFLVDRYVGFAGETWLILVGYPLEGPFAHEEFARLVTGTIASFRPESLWFIAPEIPAGIAHLCRDRESDTYYTLDLRDFTLRSPLRRLVTRASRDLVVERSREITAEHQALVAEFLEREKPAPRIERLFLRMGDYVADSATTMVLTGRDRAGVASAFYVIELAARDFATYVVGCHSKRHYVVGASDLLFHDMVTLAREQGKSYIHLGLGVNEGIRRFKEKWGGVPRLHYEFCEYRRSDLLRFFSVPPRIWT